MAIESLIQAIARTGGGEVVEHDSAACLTGSWTDDGVLALFRSALGRVPSRAPGVALGVDGLRSNGSSRLSLHQEDYHLRRRPRLLVLRCDANDVEGGDVLIAPMDPEEIAADDDLHKGLVRFYRGSANTWTPWRRLVETIDAELWIRLAFPDEQRDIEVHPRSLDLAALLRHLDERVIRHRWKVGTLLVIDNRIALHGRTAIVSKGNRRLSRWVL